MATVDKNFRIKNGLVVEGSTATVNGNNILTENIADQYILNLIGGETLVKSVDSVFNVDSSGNLTLNYSRDNVPNTVMYRDGFGNLAANQLDLDDKLTARDVRFGNAGQIKDDNGPLLIRAYSGNNIQLEADLNVNITANQSGDGGSISLTGDQVTLWTNNGAYINEDEIVTRTTGQVLANKRINTMLSFGQDNSNDSWIEGQIDGAGDLVVHAGNTLYLDAQNSDIILRPDGNAYLGNPTPGQQISTEGHVDYLIGDNTVNGSTGNTVKDRIDSALSSANTYTDTAVAGLVDSAPALLDTLNELAAALGDSPDTITNLTTSIGEKVAKSGDTMTGELVLFGDPTQANAAANKAYVDNQDSATYNDAVAQASSNAQSYANTAEQNAKSYADGLSVNYDSAGSATSAENAAKSYADSLATNYDAAGAASTAETNANTYTDSAVTDLTNGNTEFTKVSIGWMSEEVAAYNWGADASPITAYNWNSWAGASAKFIVRVRNGQHSQVSEILLTRDNSNNIAITEYAIVTTNGILGDITAEYIAIDQTISLIVTPTHNDGTEVIISGTLMSYGD